MFRIFLIHINVSFQSKASRQTFKFDVEVSVNCHSNTSKYPFDRNMCKVQLGSYNYHNNDVGDKWDL
jgi:hypothetical protein